MSGEKRRNFSEQLFVYDILLFNLFVLLFTSVKIYFYARRVKVKVFV